MGLFSFLTQGTSKPPVQQMPSTAEAQPAAAKPVEAVAIRMEGFRETAAGGESYVASDEKEWLVYLRQPLRTFRKPGVSLPEEHKMWLTARAQSRAMAAATGTRAARSN